VHYAIAVQVMNTTYITSHSNPRYASYRRAALVAAMLTGWLSASAPCTAQPKSAELPRVTQVCLVAPDILAITVETGKVSRFPAENYSPQPGDSIVLRDNGHTSILKRSGTDVGELLGEGAKRQLIRFWIYSGDALDTKAADNPGTFTISSSDDPAYRAGVHPDDVHRKSKPTDWMPGAPVLPTRHVLFLHVPAALKEGASYKIDCGGLIIDTPRITFINNSRNIRSLAVHTSQIGYRADDPFKRGYLSIWLGPSSSSGKNGTCSYPAGLKFELLDDATGKAVYSGTVEMAKRAVDKELMFRDMNFNGTDVLRMDFSSFSKPGRYRLHVDGIGCGYPFEIGPNTWSNAFRIQMRGFYNQRSGIALGPPYTPFVKPRDHHPDDGVPIFQSNWASPIWSDEPEGDVGKGLKSKATTERATNGWGGYMDAGDWNPRRVSHMKATLAQLEIADLFPEYVTKLRYLYT